MPHMKYSQILVRNCGTVRAKDPSPVLSEYVMADEVSGLKSWCIAMNTCSRTMPSTTANVSGFLKIKVIDR